MKQSEHFKILGKKYPRNLQSKINTIYFEHNNQKFEVDMLYVTHRNRYVFVQGWNETTNEFRERLDKIGISSIERQEEFLILLNKYSKLGPMKEWEK